ncbi:hypothetical protein SAMN05216316_2652 [Nitrosovibrio sp. Nv6]|nr:hypothetical protein SAMN05216316_2652 [Nitrosovibrio sp. Nv6]
MSIPVEEAVNKRQFTFNPEELKKYVLYIRNKAGSVERKGFATFLCYWSQVPYVYEEVLVEWPEKKVFWANDEGPSIGMAPMDLIDSNSCLKLRPKTVGSKCSSPQFRKNPSANIQ